MSAASLFKLGVSLVVSAVIGAPLPAAAQAKPWTSVASAGTVDEADNGIVTFNQGIAAMAGGAAVGATLDIRYNVVAVDGVFGGDGIALTARFRDVGAAERVIVRLKRYSFVTGVTQTILTLDSNAFAPAAGFQIRTVGVCNVALDFFNHSYFVDAQLIKTGAGGVPQLGAQKVGFTIC